MDLDARKLFLCACVFRSLTNNLILRTGIQMNPNRFSSGFVYNISNLDIAYSFITHHIMPTTHQLSIGFKFK